MAEYLVEGIVRIGNVQRAALLHLIVGQPAQLQPGAYPGHGLSGKVQPRPACSAADDLLRIRALAKAYLQQLCPAEVDAIQAAQDVTLAAVAEGVVLPEERFVIAPEGLVEAADLVVAA